MTAREPFDMKTAANSIALIKLKDPELQYAALVTCILDFGRRCADEALERAALEFEKFGEKDKMEFWHISKCLRSFKSAPEKKGKPKGFCKEPDCGGH